MLQTLKEFAARMIAGIAIRGGDSLH